MKEIKPSLFYTWLGIKLRCYSKNHSSFPFYGGKGIKFQENWKKNFKCFEEDIKKTIGDKPGNTYTLDRINSKLGYIKGNLRWATKTQQAENRSNNIRVKYKNKIISLKQLSGITKINYYALWERYKKGNRSENLINTPEKRLLKIKYKNGIKITLKDLSKKENKNLGSLRVKRRRLKKKLKRNPFVEEILS